MTGNRDHAGDRRNVKPETMAARAAVGDDPAYGAVSPPIYLSTSYRWDDPDNKPPFDYSRTANPTRSQLADVLADLEGAAHGIVTGTGMAAIDVTLHLVPQGGLVVAPHDCYGGSHRLLSARARKGQFDVLFINQTDDAAYDAAMARRPSLVLLETPSNPLLRITDLERCAAKARAVGAVTVCDNTFLSPALQLPIALGCDVVVHSTTKYLNGHSDVVGGAVLSADKARGEELAWWANCTGVTGPAFDSFLTLRGLRTLFVRMERQCRTAAQVARHFEHHHRVEQVFYPGLESHPGHDIAARQQRDFGAMLSIAFSPDVDMRRFLSSVDLLTSGPSLGGFESLVCVPAIMTHAGMPAEDRAKAGLTDTLTRFSIGLEDADDLIADLERAVAEAAA